MVKIVKANANKGAKRGAVKPHRSPTAAERLAQLDDLVQLASADFLTFFELLFPVLHTTTLVSAPYIEVIADALMRIEKGEYRNAIFNLPPRHMKSLLISVMYPAWCLGRDPGMHFLCISYAPELANELNALCRKLMQSPLYARIFPNTVLEKAAEEHIRTTNGGARFATFCNSVITGFGADVIIVDDPIQPSDAASVSTKKAFVEWMASSVLTRFNDPKRGVLMLVMHRLAPDDYTTDMQSFDDLLHTSLPALAEQRECFRNAFGELLMERMPGDVLNPAYQSAQELEKLRKRIAGWAWDSQYQQRPVIGGSGMVEISTLRRFDLDDPPVFELTIHSWDIGATVTGNASVLTVWGLAQDVDRREVLYLIRVMRVKLLLPEVTDLIATTAENEDPALVVIDERGVGLGVYQSLCKAGLANLQRASETSENLDIKQRGNLPNESKVKRFGRAILTMGAGHAAFPHKALWLDAFLHELAAFPNISDDDQVDSLTQILGNFENALLLARQNLSRMKRKAGREFPQTSLRHGLHYQRLS